MLVEINHQRNVMLICMISSCELCFIVSSAKRSQLANVAWDESCK